MNKIDIYLFKTLMSSDYESFLVHRLVLNCIQGSLIAISSFILLFPILFCLKFIKHFFTKVCEMTVKLLTFLLKYKVFVLANQNVANYQFLLFCTSRLRITNKTIQRR